jgi:BON domain
MHQAISSIHERPVARQFMRVLPVATALLALLVSPGRVAAEDGGLRDCVATARARQTLVQDSALAPLNLGVSVRSGAATLWGQVPSAGLGRRAEDKIRKVAGIHEVHSELRVVATEDPAAEFLRSAIAATQRPVLESFVSSRPAPSAYLTRRWVEEPAPPPVAGPGIVLLSPVTGSQPPVRPGREDLAETVERLLRAEPRFSRLSADVQGGVVRLAGTVGRDGDAMEFAQSLSRIPGVQRVVIGDVRTEVNLPGRQ